MCLIDRTGEIAYFAAGVGIVYDPANHAQRFFWGHDDDIVCLAMAPNKINACTGQVSFLFLTIYAQQIVRVSLTTILV